MAGYALITGASSGLGQGLAEELAARGWRVLGLARRPCPVAGVRHRQADLTDGKAAQEALADLLAEAPRLDLVVLNAGVLGRIAPMQELSLDECRAVMEVNLWANKTVMDALHAWGRPIRQVLMISSGASRLGNRGWGAYSLSKAALNMLARLYAHEFPDTHIAALAPGIIDTPMMRELLSRYDPEAFPALGRLHEAFGTPAMPSPREAARRVLAVLEAIRTRPSGDFVDIRELLDPEGYRALYAGRVEGKGAGG